MDSQAVAETLNKYFTSITRTNRYKACTKQQWCKQLYGKCTNFVYDTTLLSLTEEWRKELDNRKVIGLVSMDVSKAFDTLPHDLIVSKLRQYRADQKTLMLIEDYLSNRKHSQV